jgi:DNA-nicking Smr family endonuclease
VKKKVLSNKDKKDWDIFTNNIGNISIKEIDKTKKIDLKYISNKLDLHGLSLSEANKLVKKFIIESYNIGLKKILIITGKGLRSNSKKNPYVSEKLSVLKNSIPEYIKSEVFLNNKIKKISTAPTEKGGEGAFYIFLKNK